MNHWLGRGLNRVPLAGVSAEIWHSVFSLACSKFHRVSPAGGVTILQTGGLGLAGLTQGIYSPVHIYIYIYMYEPAALAPMSWESA